MLEIKKTVRNSLTNKAKSIKLTGNIVQKATKIGWWAWHCLFWGYELLYQVDPNLICNISFTCYNLKMSEIGLQPRLLLIYHNITWHLIDYTLHYIKQIPLKILEYDFSQIIFSRCANSQLKMVEIGVYLFKSPHTANVCQYVRYLSETKWISFRDNNVVWCWK